MKDFIKLFIYVAAGASMVFWLLTKASGDLSWMFR